MPSLRVEGAPRKQEPEKPAVLASGVEPRKYKDGGAAVRASVRKNLKAHCEKYFKWHLQDFHEETLQAMFEGGYLVCNYPTDHGKSTMGSFLFPLLSLMEDPNATHIICGANVNDSIRRVQALEREIETNVRLQRDFPWVTKPKGKMGNVWSSRQFSVSGRTENRPNPSVLAAAIGSADLRGRRGKLIMDDIEGEEARWSPMKRQQLYSWLKMEAWRCFEDERESSRPLLALLGTPFDVDSIYFSMERQGWKVIRYPVYKSEEKVVLYESGRLEYDPVYLWPAKKQKVMRARQTLTKLEFSVSYLMDPTGGDPSRISAAELTKRVSEAAFESDQHTGFVTLDPASGGTGPRVDYAGIAVVKINWPQGGELPMVEIQECHKFTQGLFEQVHFCAALSETYGFPVVYEGNSQQGGTYEQTFLHLHPNVKLIRHYTSHQNKFDTAMGLTVIKRLAVERNLSVQPAQLETEGIQALIHEIRDLAPPFKLHNHISAAIWFAVRYVYEKVRHSNGRQVRIVYKWPRTPLQAWQPSLSVEYADDTGLTMAERARQAMEYDARARNPQPRIMGYTAIRTRHVDIIERERQKEEQLFRQALSSRRAG